MFYSNIEPEPFRESDKHHPPLFVSTVLTSMIKTIKTFTFLELKMHIVQTVKFLIEWHHFSSSVAVCNHLKTSFVCLLKRYTFSLMHSEPEYIH